MTPDEEKERDRECAKFMTVLFLIVMIIGGTYDYLYPPPGGRFQANLSGEFKAMFRDWNWIDTEWQHYHIRKTCGITAIRYVQVTRWQHECMQKILTEEEEKLRQYEEKRTVVRRRYREVVREKINANKKCPFFRWATPVVDSIYEMLRPWLRDWGLVDTDWQFLEMRKTCGITATRYSEVTQEQRVCVQNEIERQQGIIIGWLEDYEQAVQTYGDVTMHLPSSIDGKPFTIINYPLNPAPKIESISVTEFAKKMKETGEITEKEAAFLESMEKLLTEQQQFDIPELDKQTQEETQKGEEEADEMTRTTEEEDIEFIRRYREL